MSTKAQYQLPPADVGLDYTFNNGLNLETEILPFDTDKIVYNDEEIENISSTRGGDTIKLVCLVSEKWMVMYAQGIWNYSATMYRNIIISGAPFNVGADWEPGVYLENAADAITITHLGRYKVAGNVQVHTLKIYDTSAAILASIAVDMTNTPDADGFVWGTLPSPLSLPAGSQIYFLSTEFNGGDNMILASDNSGTYDAVITTHTAAYRDFAFHFDPGAGIHCPLNFKFRLT